MTTPEPQPQPAPRPPKLRWYQYSLRSLMLFVLFCSLLCSWFATKMQSAITQRDAVAALTKAQCSVGYNDWKGQSSAPKWLMDLLGHDFFDTATSVDCGAMHHVRPPACTDATMENIGRLTHLKIVRLARCEKVTNAGMKNLEPLTELQILMLVEGSVSGEGFSHLCGLVSLCGLELGGSMADDAGLEYIGRLPGLVLLGLSRTELSQIS